MSLEWRDQLSVGNDLIDSDHRHLIGIINQAEKCLKADDRPGLTRVLNELHTYGKVHFEREERVAKAAGYPKAESLHESHGELSEALLQFKEKTQGDWPASAEKEFGTFLHDWLINHVIKEDLQMKPWMTKLSPSFVPG